MSSRVQMHIPLYHGLEGDAVEQFLLLLTFLDLNNDVGCDGEEWVYRE